jgi:uncharacterized membrane protein YozB (DUF420 family)
MINKIPQKSEKREHMEFILLNLVLLFITQPGSITFANFDAPYGFLKDFTTWMSSFIGLSLIPLSYLILKRNSIDRKVIPIYAAFILIMAFMTYYIEQLLFEGFRSPNYLPTFLTFLFTCFLRAFLSLLILPIAITNLGKTYLSYDYDIPLGLANLVILLIIISLSYNLYIRKKSEKGNKTLSGAS